MSKGNFFLFSLILGFGFFLFWYNQQREKKNFYKIAIIKTASHPALNIVIENFIKEFQEKSDQKILFIEKNAEGSITTADAIAQTLFHDKTIDLFFTAGTIASQAIVSKESKRPIFCTAVSYPEKLGISDEQSNVCGISDSVCLVSFFQNISHLFPGKKIGSIYTGGEINSTTMITAMEDEALKLGLSFTAFPFNNETDIPLALQTLNKKVDLLILPVDNTIATSIALITRIAEDYHLPLFVSDISLLKIGGIAGSGTNYEKIGNKAAKLVYLLYQNKKKPSEIGFTKYEDKTLYVNKNAFEKYTELSSLKGLVYKYL